MKRLLILIFILLSVSAIAQVQPYLFEQTGAKVVELSPTQARLSYSLLWDVPPTQYTELPEVVTMVSVTYQWVTKSGARMPYGWLSLYRRVEKGNPQNSFRVNLDFSAREVLRLSMPRDAQFCRLTFQVESRLSSIGIHERRSWHSAVITQAR